jgi:pectin methylesterase-like acyl-CoA thioesterase
MTSSNVRSALSGLLLLVGGSLSSPITVAKSGGMYATIQAAINVAMVNDTVTVGLGVYNEAVSFTNSAHPEPSLS